MENLNLTSSLVIASTVTVTGFVIHAYQKYQQNLRGLAGTPGIKTLVAMQRPVANILPGTELAELRNDWFITANPGWWQMQGHKIFAHFGQDIISSVSIDHSFPSALIVADAEAAQEIMGNRARFPKPTKVYELLNVYGRNILTTEGEEWRIHRKITAPTFNENNNKTVCLETVTAMEGLFELWKGQQTVQISNITETTTALALMIICGAGFGLRIPWVNDAIPSGHQMSFKEAVETTSNGIFLKASVPDFAMGISQKTARVRLAFDELDKYMKEMIRDRAQKYEEHDDLFSNLMAANDNDDEGLKLTNEEVASNIFIFLIAGHETTAHSLAYAVGFLGLYPDIQEKLYNQVREVIPDPSRSPTYKDVNALTYATAVFQESLRLFPMVSIMPKSSVEDTILKTKNSKGETVIVPVPRDTTIEISANGVHRNPRYWDEPDAFKPERFLGAWPKHAFLPFSAGPRSCMGRRFAEVEATIALAMLVQNYKIEIKDALVGETFEQKSARVLSGHTFITLTPNGIPVTLIRRN